MNNMIIGMVTHLLEVSRISGFLAGFIETVIPPRESRNMRKKPSAGGSSFVRAAETSGRRHPKPWNYSLRAPGIGKNLVTCGRRLKNDCERNTS
jgi:hypothetical protein